MHLKTGVKNRGNFEYIAGGLTVREAMRCGVRTVSLVLSRLGRFMFFEKIAERWSASAFAAANDNEADIIWRRD